jgi:hypothetical protein
LWRKGYFWILAFYFVLISACCFGFSNLGIWDRVIVGHSFFCLNCLWDLISWLCLVLRGWGKWKEWNLL